MTKILFITADEQRFDALSCTGNNNTKTPNLDQIASEGINYQRAYVNNVTCMPSRATMVTGQYPATHGVFSNGVPLPINAPLAARVDAPVPPCATATSVASQVPVAIVPTAVICV